MTNQVPVTRYQTSLIDALFNHHCENLTVDTSETPEYIKALIAIEQICDSLLCLIPKEKREQAMELLFELNDHSTNPIHVAEEKGFKEGFQCQCQ